VAAESALGVSADAVFLIFSFIIEIVILAVVVWIAGMMYSLCKAANENQRLIQQAKYTTLEGVAAVDLDLPAVSSEGDKEDQFTVPAPGLHLCLSRGGDFYPIDDRELEARTVVKFVKRMPGGN